MSLGQDIAPWLPFLRRHARGLTGSLADGDDLIRETLQKIIDHPKMFDRSVEPQLGLYKAFYETLDAQNVAKNAVDSREEVSTSSALSNPHGLSLSRQALLLTAMEGLSPSQAGFVLNLAPELVSRLTSEALDEVERQPPVNVLIIEDEPIIAMDLESIVRDMGHNVAGVAITRDDAVAQARQKLPSLIIADIQLADDSSGIDAVLDILKERNIPIIFLTAFPERLLTGSRPEPTFLITKPFQRSTVRAQISQALFFAKDALHPSIHRDVVESPVPEQAVRLIGDKLAGDRVDLRPSLAPADASIENIRIVLRSGSPPSAKLALQTLNALRVDHQADAARLASTSTNLNPIIVRRFSALAKALDQEVSEQSVIRLGNQVTQLDSMLSAIVDEVNQLTAADIKVFLEAVQQYLEQFQEWRMFRAEATQLSLTSHLEAETLRSVALMLENQPDEIIDPRLRKHVQETREVSEQLNPIAALSLRHIIGNVLKAIGRWLRDRSIGSTKSFNETLEKKVGEGSASILVNLVLSASTALASTLLLSPEFAWLGIAQFAVHALIKR